MRPPQSQNRETMFATKEVTPDTELKLGVAVIVEREDGGFLLERRSDCGLWGLLGGRMEVGESAAETAVRETREESGLEVELTGLLGIYSGPENRIVRYPEGDVKQLVDICFIAKVVSGTLSVSEESDELQFFRRDRLPPRSDMVPPTWEPLDDYLSGRRSLIR